MDKGVTKGWKELPRCGCAGTTSHTGMNVDGTTLTSDNPSNNEHKPMGSQGLGGGEEPAQLLGCQLEERWGRKR